MQNSLNDVNKVNQESNMKTNKKINKVRVCRREKTEADDILKGERLEQVQSLTNLGRTISWNGRSTSEIKF
jgi:hypothetical protein